MGLKKLKKPWINFPWFQRGDCLSIQDKGKLGEVCRKTDESRQQESKTQEIYVSKDPIVYCTS